MTKLIALILFFALLVGVGTYSGNILVEHQKKQTEKIENLINQ